MSISIAMSSKVKVSSILCFIYCLTAITRPSLLSLVLLDVHVLYLNIFIVCGCLSVFEFISMMLGSCCLYWLQSLRLSMSVHYVI